MSSELQDQTYESRILLAEQLLADQTKANDKRSLRQQSLPLILILCYQKMVMTKLSENCKTWRCWIQQKE